MMKIAFAAVMAMTAVVISAQGVQAQSMNVDVGVRVDVRVQQPAAQRVCNK